MESVAEKCLEKSCGEGHRAGQVGLIDDCLIFRAIDRETLTTMMAGLDMIACMRRGCGEH